jgi:putative ABC transport system permease protein
MLARTGTPLDRSVLVSLAAIEAIHAGWQEGAPDPDRSVSADDVRGMDLAPKAVTAALVGLKSRLQAFSLQRAINEYPKEPLSAILPGATLQELWGLVGTAEKALSAISVMVAATALIGMATMILTTLNERRREMAILRSVGAGPRTILGLMLAESMLLVAFGVTLGAILLYTALAVLQPVVDRLYGLHIAITPPGWYEISLLAGIVAGGVLAGLLPAIRAYRLSLADGMLVRS